MGALDDKDEIRELLCRYNRCIDFPDLDGWLACWTPDGVMEFGGRPPVNGIEELREYGSGRTGGSFHLSTNEVIELDGDEARVTSYIAVVAGADDPVIRIAGRYDDVLRRVDGTWKFARRTLDPRLRRA